MKQHAELTDHNGYRLGRQATFDGERNEYLQHQGGEVYRNLRTNVDYRLHPDPIPLSDLAFPAIQEAQDLFSLFQSHMTTRAWVEVLRLTPIKSPEAPPAFVFRVVHQNQVRLETPLLAAVRDELLQHVNLPDLLVATRTQGVFKPDPRNPVVTHTRILTPLGPADRRGTVRVSDPVGRGEAEVTLDLIDWRASLQPLDPDLVVPRLATYARQLYANEQHLLLAFAKKHGINATLLNLAILTSSTNDREEEP